MHTMYYYINFISPETGSNSRTNDKQTDKLYKEKS